MRKSVFLILLASAAMPALAAGPGGADRDARRAARAERSEPSESATSQRAQRAQHTEAVQQQAAPVQRVERVQRSESAEGAAMPRLQRVERNIDRPARRQAIEAKVHTAPVATQGSTDGETNWRARERRVAASPNIPTTTESTSLRDRGSGDRSGTNWGDRRPDGQLGTTRTRSTNWRNHDWDDHGRRWSSNWRKDHRYNWRTYRNRYSSLYRLGRYNDPFGYGYRRFSIGFSMWPSYYGNNYWLNDPWQYRLPPAYGPYRWIRYYNDALLVNIYSGEVVDVIYGFFW